MSDQWGGALSLRSCNGWCCSITVEVRSIMTSARGWGRVSPLQGSSYRDRAEDRVRGRARYNRACCERALGKLSRLEVRSPYLSSSSTNWLGQASGTSSPGCSPKVVLICSLNVSPLNSRGWGATWSMGSKVRRGQWASTLSDFEYNSY